MNLKENKEKTLAVRVKKTEYNALKLKCDQSGTDMSKAIRNSVLNILKIEEKNTDKTESITHFNFHAYFNDFKNAPLDQIRNIIGMVGICKRLGWNDELIKAFIKEKEGKNWDKKWHGRGSIIGYKDIISKYREKETKIIESNNVLNDFMDKMLKEEQA